MIIAISGMKVRKTVRWLEIVQAKVIALIVTPAVVVTVNMSVKLERNVVTIHVRNVVMILTAMDVKLANQEIVKTMIVNAMNAVTVTVAIVKIMMVGADIVNTVIIAIVNVLMLIVSAVFQDHTI